MPRSLTTPHLPPTVKVAKVLIRLPFLSSGATMLRDGRAFARIAFGSAAAIAMLSACDASTIGPGTERATHLAVQGTVVTPASRSAAGWHVEGHWELDGTDHGPISIDTTDAEGDFGGVLRIVDGPDSAHVRITATAPDGEVVERALGAVRLGEHDPDTVRITFHARNDEAVFEAYRDDAARLALRAVAPGTAAAERPVEIPDSLTRPYFDALMAVCGLAHPARDSVVELRPIHTNGHPVLRSILVYPAEDTPLMAAWQAGDLHTGVEEVDQLIDQYGLELWRFITIVGPIAVLRSSMRLDAEALAARFRGLPGVESARADAAIGGGRDIVGHRSDGAMVLDYYHRWGDCPAGCIYEHAWTFRVTNGVAEFIESSGDPLDEE